MKIAVSILSGLIIAVLGVSFMVLEIVYFLLTPFRLMRKEKKMEGSEAAQLAAGKGSIEMRKIVIFDGICVLCNNSGKFVVMHLPDPNLVSFVPYQDALSNPHVSLARIKEEFKDNFKEEDLKNRICAISGKKILWGMLKKKKNKLLIIMTKKKKKGPDAIFEICSWMYAPFPVVKIAPYLIPRKIMFTCYDLVAGTRYEWFGTQPLDENFSKSLCPYLAVKKYMMPVTADNDDDDKTKSE